jgi:hypothetical protein
MIEIRDGRIYFYHTHKTEIPARDFECISAYVCPECKNVLLAYFVGYVKELKDYAENDKFAYAYEMGNCNGGQWISLQESRHKEACKWQYVTARGVHSGVEAFLKRYNATLENKQALIDAIEKHTEGFKLIPDEIGADEPLLMWNENKIVDGAGLTWDEKWKRIGKMGEFLESKLAKNSEDNNPHLKIL